MSARNPCQNVLSSCLSVASSAQHVEISKAGIHSLGKDLMENYAKLTEDVSWNTEWHYHDPSNPPLTTQYLFVLDSLNFCFWPSPGIEYEHLASCLKKTLLQDPQAFDADRLIALDKVTFLSWFGPYDMPNPDERVLRLRELGEALEAECNGKAILLVQFCNRSAVRLVRRILELLPGFRDTAVLDGKLVHFYKRAQILCGDLWAAFGKPTDPLNPFSFHDLDELTMFADYRIPQLLYHAKVLEYDEELTEIIQNKKEILFASRMEVEIRACTVAAVEMLRAELREKYNKEYLSIELDWMLWNIGERDKETIAPHHRTLTIYY